MMLSRIKNLFTKKTIDHFHKWSNLRVAIQFSVANNIEGDYLEFGVLRGSSFTFMFKEHADEYGKYILNNKHHSSDTFLKFKARFHAFDSFQGLPKTEDKDLPLHWKGEKVMSYPRHLFEKNLKDAKVDFDRISITEGFYNESLTKDVYEKLKLKSAAIVHVDCDLYESTQTVLEFITPLIVDGTVIVFDDYFYYKAHPEKGERGAFNEWLRKNPGFSATELSKYYPGAAFIISKS